MLSRVLFLIAALTLAVFWEVMKIFGQGQVSVLGSLSKLEAQVLGGDSWVLFVKLLLVSLSLYMALFAIRSSDKHVHDLRKLRESFESVFALDKFKSSSLIACHDYVPNEGEQVVEIKTLLNESTYDKLDKNHHEAQNIVIAILKTYQITQQVKSSEEELTRRTEMIRDQYFGKLAWPNFTRIALPMLGFLGTVIGIMISMNDLSKNIKEALDKETSSVDYETILHAIIDLIGQMGVAFDTTVIALILTFFVLSRITKAQTKMELELNQIIKSFDPIFHRLTVPNWSRITERYIKQAFARAHTQQIDDDGRG
ncbi:MotA/TolQ/ExbB proton channel family protein [Agarivorans sp. TSD2052]|uniref:MotA/TolQ/ExbB proton channel family protein n=1 Tax=Agarivorans sp. TSD2052 TaxID=2937286 RepID=UPI00200F32F5|nr:MotA/TolQ/ExbB proton channel family protein [Agarivorans sp. TSD2052]UPW17728.1 MotA/TolQ/ExbB proton channel family protein [Agarivorans sp. TSD2052]